MCHSDQCGSSWSKDAWLKPRVMFWIRFSTANRIPRVTRKDGLLCQPNSQAFPKQHGDFSRSSFHRFGTSVCTAMSSTPGRREGSIVDTRDIYHSVSGLSFNSGEGFKYLLHTEIGKSVLVSSEYRWNADSDIGHFWGLDVRNS